MSLGNMMLDLTRGPLKAPGGPQALPSAQGGASAPPPPGAPPSASGAPSPATQSPPDLASLYMQMENRARAAHGIDAGLALMAASMSTPSMAQAIMGSVPQQQDVGAQLGNLMKMQQLQLQQRGMQQMLSPEFVNDMASRTGLSPAEIQAAIYSGKIGDILAGQAGIGGPSTTQEWRQARAQWHAENPGKTDADMIAAHPELATSLTYQGAQVEQGKVLAQAGEDKINAKNSFATIDPVLSASEDNLKWLSDQKNKAAVVAAIQHPAWTETGIIGSAAQAMGMSQDILTARNKIDWLKKNLYAERFQATKNVRSQVEAANLGQAATNVDSMTNDPTSISNEMDRLYGDAERAHANLIAAAGHQLTPQYQGLADPTFLDSKSPLYNGATQMGGIKLTDEEKQQARDNIARDGRQYVINYLRRSGHDISEL